jgi:hypothetical protein
LSRPWRAVPRRAPQGTLKTQDFVRLCEAFRCVLFELRASGPYPYIVARDILASEKENTPEGGVYSVLYVFVLYFVLYLYFWRRPPVTVAAAASAMAHGAGASCLGCTLGTWLCSMSNSIIYHVSCYRFVSQHTYIYHISPHAHVDTDSDSRQQQQPPDPGPAVAQIIQNNTKSSLLYYVLYVSIVLCIVLSIMYFRFLISLLHM